MGKLIDYNFERRKSTRTPLKAPLIVKAIESGAIYRGRMMNYSGNGIYLETDASLDLNAAVYLRIEGIPYPAFAMAPPDKPENLLATIRRREETQEKFFRFGYGAAINSSESEPARNTEKSQTHQDLRKYQRKPYSNTVYFSSENRYYKGSITDISRGGMFFETRASFSVGQIIRLVIPGTKIDNGVMLKAEIVHFNVVGVGVKFIGVIKGKACHALQKDSPVPERA